MKGKSGKAREVRLGKESVVKEGRQEKGGKRRAARQGKGGKARVFLSWRSLVLLPCFMCGVMVSGRYGGSIEMHISFRFC
jgi:hypothetical protein